MHLPNMYPFTDLPQYADFVDSYTPEQRQMLVRSYRNGCLMCTDWTQVADSTVDKQAWAIFRQELRDMMATYDGTTIVIDWPVPPT